MWETAAGHGVALKPFQTRFPAAAAEAAALAVGAAMAPAAMAELQLDKSTMNQAFRIP